MIEQVKPRQVIKADQMNELINWVNDFEQNAGEKIKETVTENVETIIEKELDISDIRKRLDALEKMANGIVPNMISEASRILSRFMLITNATK